MIVFTAPIGRPFIGFLRQFIVLSMLLTASLPAAEASANPVFFDEGPLPPGITDMLKKAMEKQDEDLFNTLLSTALETWPDSRIAIIRAAYDIQPDWMVSGYMSELTRFDDREATMLAQEKSRGIWYHLDPKYWNPTIEFGASFASGDSDEQAISFATSLNRSYEKWDHSINFTADFARRNGVTTRERFVLNVVNNWQAWGERGIISNNTLLELDQFSGFDWRVTEVIGVGYDFIKNDRHSLRGAVGPGFRISGLDDGTTQRDLVFLGSLTHNSKLTDDLTLTNFVGVTPATNSFRVDYNMNFVAQLNSSLAASLGFDLIYESVVPEGTENLDTVTRATLIYTF